MFRVAFVRMHSRVSSDTREILMQSLTPKLSRPHTPNTRSLFLVLTLSSRSRRALAYYKVGCSMILYLLFFSLFFFTQGAGLLRTGLLHDSIPSGRRAG